MKLKVCVRGLRRLDGDFWRAFCRSPTTGLGLVALVLSTAIRDIFMWLLNIEPPED